MFADLPTTPPAQIVTMVVIDEKWASARPPVAPPVQAALTDPRVKEAAAAVLAEAPVRDPAANRQQGLQPSAYGTDAAAAATIATAFDNAKVPACLSPATGGLGIFAIPFIAVQAVRGKCRMP